MVNNHFNFNHCWCLIVSHLQYFYISTYNSVGQKAVLRPAFWRIHSYFLFLHGSFSNFRTYVPLSNYYYHSEVKFVKVNGAQGMKYIKEWIKSNILLILLIFILIFVFLRCFTIILHLLNLSASLSIFSRTLQLWKHESPLKVEKWWTLRNRKILGVSNHKL